MMQDKKKTIQKIADMLNQKVNVEEIYSVVESLSLPSNEPDPVTLLWPNHISNNDLELLSKDQILTIEERYSKFFKEANYMNDSGGAKDL